MLLLGVSIFVVLMEEISSEVAIEVAPDRVCVVGTVLCVIVFKQPFGRLNAVVVPIT
jgi:hypothetical protein